MWKIKQSLFIYLSGYGFATFVKHDVTSHARRSNFNPLCLLQKGLYYFVVSFLSYMLYENGWLVSDSAIMAAIIEVAKSEEDELVSCFSCLLSSDCKEKKVRNYLKSAIHYPPTQPFLGESCPLVLWGGG